MTRRWVPIFTIPLILAGCDGANGDDSNLSGGQGAGGSANRGGAGMSATGGSSNGGSESSGGAESAGGTQSSGGSKSSGGAAGSLSSGGAAGGSSLGGTGGASPTGGRTADGGRAGSGQGGAAGSETGGAADGGRSGGQGGGGAAGTAGAASGGTSATGGSNGTGEYGFTYRNPGSHKFSCTTEVDVPDADWLCTFHVEGKLSYVYVQATPVGVRCVLSSFGVYEVRLAQISLDGAVSPLADAAYDWGGGHHNDSLSFSYGGKTYKYYHSSIGFGFRSCQEMDCLNVYAPGATAPEIEGCGAKRTLPEVCVPIRANGSHEPLVDKFMKCPGDTT